MEDTEGNKVDLEFLDRPNVLKSTYRAGAVIFEEGTPAAEMFVVRSGRVGASINGKIVEEIGAGGILGEMALIGQTTRTATVQALVDTEIAPINERLFTIMVHQTPFFALAMLRVLSDRLRRMNRLI